MMKMHRLLLKTVLSIQLITSIECSSDIIAYNAIKYQDVSVNNAYNLQYYQNFATTSIKFLLYLPEENNKSVEINPNNTHLLNNTRPTKILIHGINAFHDRIWVDQMVSRYHSKGGYNVIAVDWSQITVKEYVYMASVVNDVGKVVANFLIEISEQYVEFLESVHVIGFSLGAQVGAVAGEKVNESGKGTIDRLTGLDPEKPSDLGFLDQNDAAFVDVIHTTYSESVQGVGTVDIFLNIGTELDHDDEPTAEELFIVSIDDNDKFVAVLCDNVTSYVENMCNNNTKVIIGESVPRNVSGILYLTKDGAMILYPQKFSLFILTALAITFSYIISY